MKTHKTPTAMRGTYKQYDEDGHLLCEIKPGDYGVTEVTIDRMHRMDDAEVRVSIKERRLPAYMEEKAKAAKAEWIADYEQKYGRAPRPDEIPDLTHRSFVSIDEKMGDGDEEGMGEHSRIAAQMAVRPFEEEESAVEYLRALVMEGNFTERERQVYEAVFIEGMAKQDAAKKLGISSPRVTEIIKNIMKKVSEDKELGRWFTTP